MSEEDFQSKLNHIKAEILFDLKNDPSIKAQINENIASQIKRTRAQKNNSLDFNFITLLLLIILTTGLTWSIGYFYHQQYKRNTRQLVHLLHHDKMDNLRDHVKVIDQQINEFTIQNRAAIEKMAAAINQNNAHQKGLIEFLSTALRIETNASIANILTTIELKQLVQQKGSYYKSSTLSKEINDILNFMLQLKSDQASTLNDVDMLGAILDPLTMTLVRIDDAPHLIGIVNQYSELLQSDDLRQRITLFTLRQILAYGEPKKAKQSFLYKFYLDDLVQMKSVHSGITAVNAVFLQYFFEGEKLSHQNSNHMIKNLSKEEKALLIYTAIQNSRSNNVDMFPTRNQKNADHQFEKFLESHRPLIEKMMGDSEIKVAFMHLMDENILPNTPKWLKA